MTALWRLIWALPLVLLLGAAAILLLKRWVVPRPTSGAAPRLQCRESLSLSDATQIHVVEMEGAVHLIVESARPTLMQVPLGPANVQLRVAQSRPAWLRRFQGFGTPRAGVQ